jgi:hypothetical protein
MSLAVLPDRFRGGGTGALFDVADFTFATG